PDPARAPTPVGTYTIGFSTDYPYASAHQLRASNPNTVVFQPTYNSCYIPRVVPDYIRPYETKTIRFWLRRVPGTGEAAACAVVQPYIDFIRDTYPADQPPKIRGA